MTDTCMYHVSLYHLYHSCHPVDIYLNLKIDKFNLKVYTTEVSYERDVKSIE